MLFAIFLCFHQRIQILSNGVSFEKPGCTTSLHTAETVSLLWGLSAQTAHNSVS